MKKIDSLLYLLLVIVGLYTAPLHAQNNFDKLYQSAIKNAMYPPTDTKDTNLIAITPDNKNLTWKTINGEDYVLVVSWKQTNYYGDSGATNTGPYQIWVTTAPELLNRMRKEKASNPDLRLKQLLGLPPTGTYNWFIEFWVRPADLFRPCPDKEVTDKKCNTCFSAQDSLDQSYIQWVNNTRVSRYYACGLYNQYPWTSLGYTYDWNANNKSHIGLCEFVIDVNKTIYVNKVYTTAEYLKQSK
ncbi:MAG: hypothetical protein V4620_09580 [Bacteroidota bacterium]